MTRACKEREDLRPQRFAFPRENVAAPRVFARRKHVIARTNRVEPIENDRVVAFHDVFERHHGIGAVRNRRARRDRRRRFGFVSPQRCALRVRPSADGERPPLASIRRDDREAVHRGARERDEIVIGHERTRENASGGGVERDRFGA